MELAGINTIDIETYSAQTLSYLGKEKIDFKAKVLIIWPAIRTSNDIGFICDLYWNTTLFSMNF